MTEVEQPRLPVARTMSVDPPTLNLNKRGPPSSDGHDVNDNSKPIDKRRRVSRMETVAYDDIAPGKHVEQDERVMKKFLYIREGSMPELDILLSQIVRNCDKMNADYRDSDNAEEILQTHPALKEELEEAWKDGTFTRIRLLSMPGLHRVLLAGLTFEFAEILRPAASQPQPDAVIVVSRHDSLRRESKRSRVLSVELTNTCLRLGGRLGGTFSWPRARSSPSPPRRIECELYRGWPRLRQIHPNCSKLWNWKIADDGRIGKRGLCHTAEPPRSFRDGCGVIQ
jgi:hypothetical protein